MGQIGCPTLFSFWGVVMLFEDFVVDLFNNIKSPDGALSCFVYVDGEELLNTTCLFKDVLVNATACADRLSLAIDPIIGQAAREKKSISLMAVVSAGKNDEVYRFKYANGDLVSNQHIRENNILPKTELCNISNKKSIEERAMVSDEVRELMKKNGITEDEERYKQRISILRKIHCGKPVEHSVLHKLFNEYTKTFF